MLSKREIGLHICPRYNVKTYSCNKEWISRGHKPTLFSESQLMINKTMISRLRNLLECRDYVKS